jgi:hypothetical protein
MEGGHVGGEPKNADLDRVIRLPDQSPPKAWTPMYPMSIATSRSPQALARTLTGAPKIRKTSAVHTLVSALRADTSPYLARMAPCRYLPESQKPWRLVRDLKEELLRDIGRDHTEAADPADQLVVPAGITGV